MSIFIAMLWPCSAFNCIWSEIVVACGLCQLIMINIIDIIIQNIIYVRIVRSDDKNARGSIVATAIRPSTFDPLNIAFFLPTMTCAHAKRRWQNINCITLVNEIRIIFHFKVNTNNCIVAAVSVCTAKLADQQKFQIWYTEYSFWFMAATVTARCRCTFTAAATLWELWIVKCDRPPLERIRAACSSHCRIGALNSKCTAHPNGWDRSLRSNESAGKIRCATIRSIVVLTRVRIFTNMQGVRRAADWVSLSPSPWPSVCDCFWVKLLYKILQKMMRSHPVLRKRQKFSAAFLALSFQYSSSTQVHISWFLFISSRLFHCSVNGCVPEQTTATAALRCCHFASLRNFRWICMLLFGLTSTQNGSHIRRQSIWFPFGFC